MKILEKIDKHLNERFIGFGKNGAVEIHGNTVVISKNGKSVELTKEELRSIVKKVGL
jgi:hypothetical protein